MTPGSANLAAVYLLALLRVGGVVAFAPVFGDSVLPRRIKLLIALTLTLGLLPVLPSVTIPSDTLRLILIASGEIAFGVILGLSASLVFAGVRCAGEIVGQQLGLSLAQVLDPTSGEETSLLANFYMSFATVIFLLMNGHHAVIRILAATFNAVPLASASIGHASIDLLAGLFQSVTILVLQLTAPVVLTMVIVDLALGMATRLIPQLNVMSLAVSARSVVGIVLLLLGAVVTAKLLGSAMTQWMSGLSSAFAGGA